jgi:hypothetical protein
MDALGFATGSDAHAATGALVLPKVLAFSSLVWKRPAPFLEEVSMNFSLISSKATRLVWGIRDIRRVMQRFFVPGTAPCRTP